MVVETGKDIQVILSITVGSHPVFQRKGLDLLVNADIDLVEATLGGTIRVPTLEKDTEISIPAGTQYGDKLRLRAKGIRQNGRIGDLYVIVKVIVPKRLSERQKELLYQFMEEEKLKKAA